MSSTVGQILGLPELSFEYPLRTRIPNSIESAPSLWNIWYQAYLGGQNKLKSISAGPTELEPGQIQVVGQNLGTPDITSLFHCGLEEMNYILNALMGFSF